MCTIRSFRPFEIAALFISLCVSHSIPCRAEQAFVPPAEPVEISLSPLPFDLKGLLRRPEGSGRFPAVVPLPACGLDAYRGLNFLVSKKFVDSKRVAVVAGPGIVKTTDVDQIGAGSSAYPAKNNLRPVSARA